MIKVTPRAIKVTPFDGVTLIGLLFRISSKKLIVTYRKGIELKANYIVLHSVAGACVMLHIFKTFEKPPKLIKVIRFHGTFFSLMILLLIFIFSCVVKPVHIGWRVGVPTS